MHHKHINYLNLPTFSFHNNLLHTYKIVTSLVITQTKQNNTNFNINFKENITILIEKYIKVNVNKNAITFVVPHFIKMNHLDHL